MLSVLQGWQYGKVKVKEGHLHSSANLVASLSLTFRMTRSSMMSQKLYVQDITLRAKPLTSVPSSSTCTGEY